MSLNKSKINKILVISLSNIGDIVLTFPVIDILRNDFPNAELSLVVGPKGESLFDQNPHIKQLHIYDKHQKPIKTIRWINQLRKERFDLIVDLKNTMIPLMSFPRYRTSLKTKKWNNHMRDKHLSRLSEVYDYESESEKKYALYPSDDIVSYVKRLQHELDVKDKSYVVLAPGAAAEKKRWSTDGFAKVADTLIDRHGLDVLLVGNHDDYDCSEEIKSKMQGVAHNCCGRTTLVQLAYLLKGSLMLIANDSGIMHIASYVDIPIIALFGASDPRKYGPWSGENRIIVSNDSSAITTILPENVLSLFDIENGNVLLKV